MKCHQCGGNISAEASDDTAHASLDKLASTLKGDVFLRALCARCSGEGHLQLLRLHLSWYQGKMDPTTSHSVELNRVDVVHLILYHMIMSRECENCIEGLKFFHWRHICEEITAHWRHLWDRESTQGHHLRTALMRSPSNSEWKLANVRHGCPLHLCGEAIWERKGD